eukprot:12401351-Karenia_brevis.AAC.1
MVPIMIFEAHVVADVVVVVVLVLVLVPVLVLVLVATVPQQLECLMHTLFFGPQHGSVFWTPTG